MSLTFTFPAQDGEAFRRALSNIQCGLAIKVGVLEPCLDPMFQALADVGWRCIQLQIDTASGDSILSDVLPEGQPVHFMRADVRWLGSLVLYGISPSSAQRPWLLAIEDALPEREAEIDGTLSKEGYVLGRAEGSCRYYIAVEQAEMRLTFAVLKNGSQHQCGAWRDRVEQLEGELTEAKARAKFDVQRALREQLEERKVRLNADAVSAQLQEALEDRASIAISASHNAMLVAQMRAAVLWRVTARLGKFKLLMTPGLQSRMRHILKVTWRVLSSWRVQQSLCLVRPRNEVQNPRNSSIRTVETLHCSSYYGQWIDTVEKWSDLVEFPRNAEPLVSFLIFDVASNIELDKTLDSIRGQSYPYWEVIICTTPPLHGRPVPTTIPIDSRVRFCGVAPAGSMSCLELSIKRARGEFVSILDAGDLLATNALNEIAAALHRMPEADVLYSDEDKLSSAGLRAAPYFKPCWSPDLLYAFNYFGRLSVLRHKLVKEVSRTAQLASTAFEWDLNLRVSDQAQNIVRIPKVLCHVRSGSHRFRAEPHSPAAEDSRSVIEQYWARLGFDALAETQSDGTQRIRWRIPIPPLISVVIPTRNESELLRICIDGLVNGTDYDRKEIVIVDTGSDDLATFAYYLELAAVSSIRIVYFRKEFNYSAARNYGASFARGQLLLFLNYDIEVVSREWLQELVGFAMRPGVGAVGAKLVNPSGELQHGGVGIGIGIGIGVHLCALMYRSAAEDVWGVFGSPSLPRNWLAITGACQIVRREVFDQVGGFDESYHGAMSDVALCLRIWRAGFRIAYAPHARLVHHEGATRGSTNPVFDIRRVADDIRALGIDEDPYLHPELNGYLAIPTLRSGDAPSMREILRIRLRDDGSPVMPSRLLDLSDDSACVQACGVQRDELLWPPQAVHLICDRWSAARWCLDLLRTRTDIRLRFPLALSGGASGAFVGWLKSDGREQLSLPTGFDAAVDELFSKSLSARARQLFFFCSDVRHSIPHGLTPVGQKELLRWFVRSGRPEFGLRLEEIWWLLWEAAENPALELARAYLFTPDWQRRYPDALTIFGRDAFAAWFSATYRVRGSWTQPAMWPSTLGPAQQLRLAYQARESWRLAVPSALADPSEGIVLIDWLQSDQAMQTNEVRDWCKHLTKSIVANELAIPGVNVIGHFCYPSGLRVSVEALVCSLHSAGIATSLRDLRTDKEDDARHIEFDAFETFDITIIHTQPDPFFADAYELSDLAERSPKTYRIAYWYWEFDSVPDAWIAKATAVDEVWVATEFVAKGLREKLKIPVKTLFPGVQLGSFKRREKSHFGLNGGAYTFLFVFHMMSIMERKNPLGLIRAFKRAFVCSEPVQLVLKTSFGDRHPAQLKELRAAADGSNIVIIDQVYTSDEVLSLMETCDAYVSLHRSEGLGLTMAEAMLMGKPVIATNYSGNVDFMDESNSLLVPYTLVNLGRCIPPYDAKSIWAEPSIHCAAYFLRQVFENQQWARELGKRAKASAESRLSVKIAGAKIGKRLSNIQGTLNPATKG